MCTWALDNCGMSESVLVESPSTSAIHYKQYDNKHTERKSLDQEENFLTNFKFIFKLHIHVVSTVSLKP